MVRAGLNGGRSGDVNWQKVLMQTFSAGSASAGWLGSFSAWVNSLWVPGEKPGYQSQASPHLKSTPVNEYVELPALRGLP